MTAKSPTLPLALAVITSLVVLAYVPLFWAHAESLWTRPHYQFFPFVWVGAAVLVAARFPGFESLRPGGRWRSALWLGWSWLLLAAAEAIFSPWLGAVALLFLLLAVGYTLGGRTLLGALLPAWVLLWLMVPPPLGLDRTLVLGLQGLTSRWSSALLDLAGVYHVIAANVVEIGNQRLFVEEACTGINSLFSILACTLFYVFFCRVPALRAALLLVAAVFWILLANVARVFLVAYLAKRTGIDVAEGWRHDALGFLLFGMGLGLIWSSDRLLMFLTPGRKKQIQVPGSVNLHSSLHEEAEIRARVLGGTWLNSWIAGSAFALLLLFHLVFYTWPSLAVAAPERCQVINLQESTLPDKLNGWQREGAHDEMRNPGSAFGEFSKTWRYRGESYGVLLSLDYPFPEWHDLAICYKGQGWVIERGETVPALSDGAPAFYYLKLKKAGLRCGYVCYGEFDQAGRPVEATQGGVFLRKQAALKRGLAWLDQKPVNQPSQVGSLLQFQLFVDAFTPLNADEEEKVKENFRAAYNLIQTRLFSKELP